MNAMQWNASATHDSGAPKIWVGASPSLVSLAWKPNRTAKTVVHVDLWQRFIDLRPGALSYCRNKAVPALKPRIQSDLTFIRRCTVTTRCQLRENRIAVPS